MNKQSFLERSSQSRQEFWDLADPSQEEILLEPSLLEMIRLRVALIHGCQFCADMHAEALKVLGESAKRIAQLKAWTEYSSYEEREYAALALTDALSAMPSVPIPKNIVQDARSYFNDAEILQLVLTIFASNDGHDQAIHQMNGTRDNPRHRQLGDEGG